MKFDDQNTAVLDAPEGLEFTAEDVTGTQEVSVTLSARGGHGMPMTAPAGVVARALAARMRLPDDVPWTLRDNESCSFLDEAHPIGEQVRRHAKLTLLPKAHLGGRD